MTHVWLSYAVLDGRIDASLVINPFRPTPTCMQKTSNSVN